MSEFDDLLQVTKEARKQSGDLKEYTDDLAKMLGFKIESTFERHQGDIMALDEELRDRLFKAVREKFENSIIKVQTKKEVEL